MDHKKTYQKGRLYPWNLDHLINEVLNTSLGDVVKTQGDFTQRTPPVNVIEADNYFKLEMAVPGLSKKDINLKIDGDILTLSSDHKSEDTEGESVKIRQFSFGTFSRTYKLPKVVDRSAIKAHMSHGILTVTLAKKEDEAPINVEIS